MKGLIIKELIALKKQWFPLMLIVGGFSISAVGEGNFSFALFIPVVMSILPINSMALDEQCKWQAYAIAMPYGRKNIVSSKYVFYIINTLISMSLLTVIYIISDIIHSEISISLPVLLISGLISGSVYPLIMLPLTFKFNSTTGRTILIVISMIFGGIIGALTSIIVFQEIDGETIAVETVVNAFNSPLLPIVIIAIIAVLYLISWTISVKIYEKRDL